MKRSGGIKGLKTESAVMMVGLDFGSTTSSAIVAKANVGRNSATGRMAFGHPEIVYRSEPIFTPFSGNSLDEDKLNHHLDRWLEESGVDTKDLFSGGAIITGLATEKENAERIVKLVKERVGEAIIATASDPSLESWLAFMGSCSTLSRYHAEQPIINLDIGGGTTNPALGLGGTVLSTGCYLVGARHFQFVPGTYQVVAISNYGRLLLKHLGINRNIGDTLRDDEREIILQFYVDLLESVVAGHLQVSANSTVRDHIQVQLKYDNLLTQPVVTFSGGVGELIYQYGSGFPLPGTTYFGDLGIDLARKICESPRLSSQINDFVPGNQGRATVYGLAIHSTEISGTTLFFSNKKQKPLQDIPIVGRVTMEAGEQQICSLLEMINKSGGGAIQVIAETETKNDADIITKIPVEKMERVKRFGQTVQKGVVNEQISPEIPIILIVPHNCGKSLGSYASNWRKSSANIIVIDEIPDRNAHFVNIGTIKNNIVPVSFYGVQ